MRKSIRKIYALIFVPFILSSCNFGRVISNSDYSTESHHSHKRGAQVEENRVEPTCTKDGSYDLVTYCVDDNIELSRERRTIPALGHSLIYHDGKDPTCTESGYAPYRTCSRCDYSTFVEVAAIGHTPSEAVVEDYIEATCIEQGCYDLVVYCEVDGVELSREHRTIPALGHDLIHHDGKSPTCTEDGFIPYDTCSRCDYSNYETIKASGHIPQSPVEENRVEPTCTKDGSYELVTYCSVDGAELSREIVDIPAVGHLTTTKVRKNIIEATCTDDGSYDYVEYCNSCGEKIKEDHVIISATGHHLVHHHGKESSCLEQGYDEYYECDKCDYSTKELKDLLPHVQGYTKIDNIVAPTDDAPGTFDMVTLCSVGGEELTRKTYEIGNSEHVILTTNKASIFEQDYYRFYLDSSSDVQNVSWSVSNEEILTINSNGKLASYGSGESIVLATDENGEFASAYLEIKEDLIDISAPSNTYFPGDSFNMIINENSRGDNKHITWASSNEDVATISSAGLVSVLVSGQTTIKATLPSGKYDECSITIGEHYLDLKSLSHTMYRNDTFNLLSGCSAPSSVTWTSSNTSVATVSSNGVVTAKSLGTATITASSSLCGTKTCTITVTSASGNLTTSNYSTYLSLSVTLTKIQDSGSVWYGWYAVVSVSFKNGWRPNGSISITIVWPFRNAATYGEIKKTFTFSTTSYTSPSTYIMDTSYNTNPSLMNPYEIKPSWNLGSISGTVEK